MRRVRLLLGVLAFALPSAGRAAPPPETHDAEAPEPAIARLADIAEALRDAEAAAGADGRRERLAQWNNWDNWANWSNY